jgi:murein DD-endopeptidase MepM/ murein hydrolase activator NlpD
VTPVAPRRRLRELSLSLLVAGVAMLVIARTTSAEGLAVAQTSLVAHDATRVVVGDVAAQQVDDAATTVDGYVLPVRRYSLTARFGERGGHWHLRHSGLDFKAPWGAPVYAIQSGRVIKLAWHPAYGRMVILQVSPGVTIWYCHLSSVLAKIGPVTAGQLLGRVGRTGNATGPHLHLEVRVHDRPTDPYPYLFAASPGHPARVPSWYPAVPTPTVASLERLPGR